jgi:hypothetical protein
VIVPSCLGRAAKAIQRLGAARGKALEGEEDSGRAVSCAQPGDPLT